MSFSNLIIKNQKLQKEEVELELGEQIKNEIEVVKEDIAKH